MMNYIEKFPEVNFPVGKFRAFVIDCRAEENSDNEVTIFMSLLLVEPVTQNIYSFEDVIINNVYVPYSKEFFDFIDDSEIVWEQYEDFIGMTFDAEIICGQNGDRVYPMITNRKLLAAPVSIEA